MAGQKRGKKRRQSVAQITDQRAEQRKKAKETIVPVDANDVANQDEFANAESYFGFSPEQFVDNVITSMYEYCCDGVDNLEAALVDEPSFAKHKHDIQTGSDKLFNMLLDSLQENVDRFELYVFRNILKVPSRAIPPFDSKEKPSDVSDVSNVDEQLLSLRKQLATVCAYLLFYSWFFRSWRKTSC